MKSIASDALKQAYCRTAYNVDHPDGSFMLSIGEKSAKADALLREAGETRWAYITASNPRSKLLPAETNRVRHDQLRELLHSQGLRFFPGTSAAHDSGWPSEESFLVIGISPQAAMEIGARFEQNAVVIGVLDEASKLAFC